MAAWRRAALAAFPSLKRDLHDRAYSYYQLYFDLLPMVRAAHVAGDDVTLRKIYGFAAWCLQQRRRAGDLYNAACVAFYEHLFDRREDWAAVLPWLSPAVIDECWPLWEARRSLWEDRFGAAAVRELWEALHQRNANASMDHAGRGSVSEDFR